MKLKSHRGAAKRFKFTAKSKVKRSRAYASHLLTGKSSKRARRLRVSTLVSKAEETWIKRLLPYG